MLGQGQPSRFLLTLLVQLLCWSSLPAEEFKIGAILHLTGDIAMQSVAFLEGMQMAVDDINQQHHYPIERFPQKNLYALEEILAKRTR